MRDEHNIPMSERTRAYHPVSTRELPSLCAESGGCGLYDLIVSFSGLEHDGLGRYGDPIFPDGDLAAMETLHEIRLLLSPNGTLLLGVPTSNEDDVVFPWHRICAPERLPVLLRGFDLVGRA